MVNESPNQQGQGVGRAAQASVDLLGNILGNVDRLVAGVRRDGLAIARESQALYRAAAGRAGLMRDTVKATPRMARVITDGMRIIGAYQLHLARARHAPAEVSARRLEALHRKSARRLYELCIDLRGGVLKLGQFLSCRMDLLPPAYIEELSALQDRVPAVPADEIIARLEAELGQPLAELFAEFDPEPIAAASLAQVHRAVMPDGRAVAVKVQVPGIDEVIDSDLAALRVLAGAAGDLVPQTDLTTFAAELSRSIRRELDFAHEADELRAFRAAFDGDELVIVPEVIDVYSTERVLTMELIEGERLTEWLDGCAERDTGAADRDALFTILLRSFCQQILADGAFHGDPHPGNFLVVAHPDGPRLALLDFGCVARLAPGRQRAYADVAAAVLARDATRIASALGRMGFETRSGEHDSLVTFAEMMLEQFRDGAADLSTIDPRAQLERAMAVARDNPVITVPEDFVLLGRVFGSLGGLLMHYRPTINLFAIIAPHLARAMARPAA